MLCLVCPPTYLLHTSSSVPLGTERLSQLCWLWLMHSEAVLSASHLFKYEFCTLTIVTAIVFQDIWFPERLLKLLGCRGQLILLPWFCIDCLHGTWDVILASHCPIHDGFGICRQLTFIDFCYISCQWMPSAYSEKNDMPSEYIGNIRFE